MPGTRRRSTLAHGRLPFRGGVAAIVAVVLGLGTWAGVGSVAARRGSGEPANAAPETSVLQHHNSPARDGLYVEPALTRAAAARLHRDPAFHAAIAGPVYAQPLFWAAARPGDRDLIIVATEQNRVYAVDASSGAVVWQQSLGASVPLRALPCGNIDPLGITGTPIIDPASRTVFLAALTTPDGGRTKKHLIVGLSLDDGSTRPGWPVDVSATVRAGSLAFDSAVQNQRGALALLDGTLYVPYGGHYGDCGAYHGWVVGVSIQQPGAPRAWATRARGGGVWAPGGLAADGSAVYAATGNTFGASTWADGEAVIRFGSGPTFSGQRADYFAPADWRELDATDADLGGSGPLLIEVSGARPSRLVVALGKNGDAYLLDRPNLGGIGAALVQRRVSRGSIINAAAAYMTTAGTYVAFTGRGVGCPSGQSGDLVALRIAPASPPTMNVAWCAAGHGRGSPMVTTTDGRSEAIVWSVGAEGDNRLRGFDGETGRPVFDGGGPGDRMSLVRRFQTPIVARGRIIVAGDDQLYAFTAR
jgi:putative pyrroloquinoline-quinone binding quinoprotein